MESLNLYLSDELLLAKGGERLCYLHPYDPTKVIKITSKKRVNRSQNKLDDVYHRYLMKSKKNLDQVTECFGFVETNLGKGLVFTRVLDYNGEASYSLEDVINKKLVPIEHQRQLLRELMTYLSENQILFVDIGCSNIFCQQLSEHQYRFVIVDGLGARRLNYKYWLYVYIGFYRRFKIKKQSIKMIDNHERRIS